MARNSKGTKRSRPQATTVTSCVGNSFLRPPGALMQTHRKLDGYERTCLRWFPSPLSLPSPCLPLSRPLYGLPPNHVLTHSRRCAWMQSGRGPFPPGPRSVTVVPDPVRRLLEAGVTDRPAPYVSPQLRICSWGQVPEWTWWVCRF